MLTMTRFSRSIRVLLAGSIVAAIALTGPSAHAFLATDGAGIETRDTPSGGPAISQYVDVSATCGLSCRIEVGDDQIVPVSPPFGQPNWPFHWSSSVATQGVAGGSAALATVWLDSNGYITFQQPAVSTFVPTALPNAAAPNALVAGVWTDLDPSITRLNRGIFKQIVGTSPNRLMYLQWNDVPNFGNTCTSFTFEFILSEVDNSVVVHYRDNPCSTRVGTGGQENSGGTAGTTYFNGTAIPDNIAVRYRDITAPGVLAPEISCSIGGTNGWCRSATNTVTITDDGDLGASAIGVGVKTRAWKLGAASQGAYISGDANTVTRPDGTHSATGTATDWAGNASTSAATTFKVDATAPALTVATSPAPNAAGWHNDDVTATWTCADATSGVAACAGPSTITGEGVGLTASQTIFDIAGNSKATTTAPVKIDRTPPATTASAPTGWSTSDTVTLSPADGLSGVAATTYEIDGLSEQTGTQIQLSEGVHQVVFWSEDNAGNVEDPTMITVRVDYSAPSIVHDLSPVPNAAGWNKSATTVTFTCSDTVSEIALCTPPTPVTNDAAAQVVNGTATDLAGNSAQDFAIVNLDQVPPSLTAGRTPAANANGWNNTPVDVAYSCSDALSGIASCPGAQTFSQGAAQTASGVADDIAGNETTVTIPDINVDLQVPDVAALLTPAPNAAGWNTGDVTVHWVCTDNLSGVVSCPPDTVVTGEGIGLSASSGLVADRAGNVASTIVTVNIDRTPPVLFYEGALPEPNSLGWNRTAVDMVWSCSDGQSSTPTPSIVKKLTGETSGTNQTATCYNNAGLSASDTQGPVRIDLTAPTAAAAPGPVPVILGLPVAQSILPEVARGTATDLRSGTGQVILTVDDVITGVHRTLLASCPAGCGAPGVAQWEVSAGMLGLGLFQLRARAIDRAGNQGVDSAPILVLVVAV